MRILLRRFAESPDGTFGKVYIPPSADVHVFYTAEEEWRNNERNESRIPAGVYTCKRSIYYRYGYETFEVTGVPDRSRILFHPGNTEEDTAGCILIGDGVGMLEVVDEETGERRDKLGVHNSRASFARFMSMLEDVDEFELEIRDPEWSI